MMAANLSNGAMASSSPDSKKEKRSTKPWWGNAVFVLFTAFLTVLPYLAITAIIYIGLISDVVEREGQSSNFWVIVERWGWLLYLLFGIYFLVVWFGPKIGRSAKLAWTLALLLVPPIAMPVYWYRYLFRELTRDYE